MAKQKSRTKQQKRKQEREQGRKKATWETEPIGASWVPFAMALAVGLPALGLAAWNRGQLSSLKETTQPVPDSEKNIKELWDSIRSVQSDQRLQKALIEENKNKLSALQTTLDEFPNREELEETGKRLEAINQEGGQIQTKIRADMEAISEAKRKLEDKLEHPWYSIAAPIGAAFLWGAGAFVLTYPAFGYVLFPDPQPKDEKALQKLHNRRLTLSSGVAAITAGIAWLSSGGPQGLGVGG